MSKLTGLHSIFRKNSIFQSKHRFLCINVRKVPQEMEMFKNLGRQLWWLYRDIWSVNCTWMRCWGLLPCLFCAKTSDSTRPRITMPEHTSTKTMLCVLTGQTCLWHIWTEGPTHNNGSKKLLAPRYSVAGDIDADSYAPNQKNYSEYAKPVLVTLI